MVYGLLSPCGELPQGRNNCNPQNGSPDVVPWKNIMLFCYVVILVRIAYSFKGYRVRSRVRPSYTYIRNYVHCSSPLGGSQVVLESSH